MDTANNSAFDIAMQAVSQEEGGYSDRTADPGGATNFGITHVTYDAWRTSHELPTQDVKLISKEEEYAIYRAEFWNRISGDELASRSLPLAVLAMDWSVQSGQGRAIVELQHLLNLGQDGVIGPKTLQAISDRLKTEEIKGGTLNGHTLVTDYAALRAHFLADWAARHPGNPGVLKRVPQLLRFIQNLPQTIPPAVSA